MSHDNLTKTHSECTEILKYIFKDAATLFKSLTPDGWINSDFVHFLHPTPEQQYDENKLMNKNINRLFKKGEEDEENHSDINEFTQDILTDISAFEEFLYVFGLAVYDIFSNNHDVTGHDKKIFNLGSFRGSGSFIADFINENYKSRSGSYDYTDFYMGSIWIRSRGDLTPFYEFVFLKLRELHCDWNYFFPRLFLIEPNTMIESNEHVDPSEYKPELAVIKEFKLSDEDQQAKNLREEFDQSFGEEYEEAKYKPLNAIVKAYKNVYGVLPLGHPQKEFE
jgi:hypothetical protein